MKNKNITIINFLDVEGLESFFYLGELNQKVIVGIDAGLGISQNSLTAIQFISLKTGEQVLEYNGKANHYETAQIIRKILENTDLDIIYVVVERNNFGKLFIDELQLRFPDFEFFSSNGKDPGFYTTASTRNIILYNYVFDILKQSPEVLKSRRLYAELQSLYIDPRTGKIKTTLRDDLIVAFGLATLGRYYYIRELATEEELSDIIFPKSLEDIGTYNELYLPIRVNLNLPIPYKRVDIYQIARDFNDSYFTNYIEKLRLLQVVLNSKIKSKFTKMQIEEFKKMLGMKNDG